MKIKFFLLCGVMVLSTGNSHASPKSTRVPGYKDPAALIVIVPQYQTVKPQIVNIQPALNFARTLAMGRYQVRIIVGSEIDGNTEPFDKIIEWVSSVNDEAAEVNKARSNKLGNTTVDSQPMYLHDIELIYERFQTAQELSNLVEEWMDDRFTYGDRAAHGWIAMRGHGELRVDQLSVFDKERRPDSIDTFLAPGDRSGEGGYSQRTLENQATHHSIPLHVNFDMCRTWKSGSTESDISIEFDQKLNAQTDTVIQTSDDSLSEIFAMMRPSGESILWGGAGFANVTYSCSKEASLPEASAVSCLTGQSIGLSSKKGNPNELVLNGESEAMLFEVYDFAEDHVRKHSGRSVNPIRSTGPIDQNMVVYSLDENWIYPPVHNDLTLNAKVMGRNSLTVEKDGPSYVFKRTGKKYDEGVVASLLLNPTGGITKSGIAIDSENLWLEVVLQLESESERPIWFIIQPTGNGSHIFPGRKPSNFLSSHCHATSRKQLRMNGIPYRFSIPLDGVSFSGDQPNNRLISLNISSPVASGTTPEARTDELDYWWAKEDSIRLLSSKVLTEAEVIPDGFVEDPSAIPYYFSDLNKKNVLKLWWGDQILRRSRKTFIDKSSIRTTSGRKIRVNLSGDLESDSYDGVIEGAISPPFLLRKGQCELQFTIRTNSSDPTALQPHVGFVLYSKTDVLEEREYQLEQEINTISLAPSKDGVCTALSIGFSNCSDVTIESIELIPILPVK